MTALLRYLSGYVCVELTGYATERFLNLCTNHDINLWNMDHKEDTYTFCMSLEDFRKIRPMVRKTRTKIRITKRCGLPFFLYRYRKRKMFLLGLLLCVGIVYAFSCYVWNIEICGNSTLSDDTVYRYLESEKIRVGTAKGKVDCEKLEAKIRQHFSNVIWTSVRLEGTKLTVDVKENLITQEPQEKQETETEEAQDLVADKDAVILSIVTRNGTPKVKAGDKVKKGKALVLGRIDIYNDAKEIAGYQYCKADADIVAQTSYPYRYEVPTLVQKKAYTGKEKKRYSFWYRNKYIGLYQNGISYRFYDKESEKEQLCVMENFYLPFYIQTDIYREYQMKNHKIDKKEAKKMAEDNLELFLSKLEEKGLQIIEKNVMMDKEKNSYIFQGTVLTKEKLESYRATKQLEVPKEEGTVENESE